MNRKRNWWISPFHYRREFQKEDCHVLIVDELADQTSSTAQLPSTTGVSRRGELHACYMAGRKSANPVSGVMHCQQQQ